MSFDSLIFRTVFKPIKTVGFGRLLEFSEQYARVRRYYWLIRLET